MIKLSSNTKRAFFGGAIAAVIMGTGAYSLGSISGYEAKELITTSLPGINTLCNTIALAAATILALLLTLLSISSSTKSKLNKEHYRHVLLIAKLDTVVFILSLVAFQLLNIPVTEAKNVPTEWYSWFYYISLTISAILSGGSISVALMLYYTVSSIIRIVGLGEDHPLINSDDNDE